MAEKLYYVQIQNAEKMHTFIESGEITSDNITVIPIIPNTRTREVIGFTINKEYPISGSILQNAKNNIETIRNAMLVARYLPRTIIDDIMAEVNANVDLDKIKKNFVYSVPTEKYLFIDWDKLKIRDTEENHVPGRMVGKKFNTTFTLPSPDSGSTATSAQDTATDFDMWSSTDIGESVRAQTGGKRKSKKARSIKKKTRKAKRRNSHKKK